MAKRGPKGPRKWTEARLEILGNELIKYGNESEKPLECEFASKNGCVSSQFSDFKERSKKFALLLKQFKEIQKTKWTAIVLTAKNQAGAIFLAKNITDYRDEQYIKGEGFNNIMQVTIPAGYKPRHENNRLLPSNVNRTTLKT